MDAARRLLQASAAVGMLTVVIICIKQRLSWFVLVCVCCQTGGCSVEAGRARYCCSQRFSTRGFQNRRDTLTFLPDFHRNWDELVRSAVSQQAESTYQL